MEKKKYPDTLRRALESATVGAADSDIYWFKFIPTRDVDPQNEPVFTEVAVSSDGIIFIPTTMLCASVFVMQAIMEDREIFLDAEDGYYVPLEWARANFPVLAPMFKSVDELMSGHVEDIVSNRRPVPITVH